MIRVFFVRDLGLASISSRWSLAGRSGLGTRLAGRRRVIVIVSVDIVRLREVFVTHIIIEALFTVRSWLMASRPKLYARRHGEEREEGEGEG